MNPIVMDGRRTPRLTPWAVVSTLFVLVFLLLLALAAAAEGGWEGGLLFRLDGVFGGLDPSGDPAASERGSWLSSQAIIGIPVLLIVLLAAFGLASVVLSDKMMIYWMKHLIHPATPGEKRLAIEELRRVKDPGAFLALIDVAMDPEEDEKVRQTAAEAVHGINTLYPGRGDRVTEIEAAIETDDPRGIIEALTASFEARGRTYAQSAFAIGHQYMRLGQYADARKWLQKARPRDEKLMLYGNRVDRLIQACNDRLLAEGDALYAAGNYHGAREHYALLSNGLDDQQKRRFAAFLRSACVYCKLKDYRDAGEAVLLALHFGQETDKSLILIDLLQKLPGRNDKAASAKEVPETIRKAIDKCVAGVMDGLRSQQNAAATAFAGTGGTA